MTAISDNPGLGGTALKKFIMLGRDESGAALVTTLALFMLMYLACLGVYSVSTAVREKIHLQNAADAAAYSAAIVQADTLSRVAAINRAMSWTYVDMSRRQMDYIVYRWLKHTRNHFNQDRARASSFNECFAPLQPCTMNHGGSPNGWFIGSNGYMDNVQLNGISCPLLGELYPLGSMTGMLNLGSRVHVNTLNSALSAAEVACGVGQYGSYDPTALALSSDSALRALASTVMSYLKAQMLLCPTQSNQDTIQSLQRMVDELNGSGADSDSGMSAMLKAQIVIDRLNIGAMNILERQLVAAMPGKIRSAVREVLKANVPEYMLNDCLYYIAQNENPLANEENYDPDGKIGGGYFRNLYNISSDERRFLAFAGYDQSPTEEMKLNDLGILTEMCAGGMEQWFVRGNGWRRTDGGLGLQRSYKHWSENSGHPAHSPYAVTCWNTEKLHGSPQSISLHSDWEWFSGKWICICYHGLFVHIDEHLGYSFCTSCPHGGGKDDFMAQVTSLPSQIADLSRWPSYLSSALSGLGPYSNGDESIPSTDPNSYGGVTPAIDGYRDTCLFAWDLEQIARDPSNVTAPLRERGYSRLYGDDPHLYNSCYVGERAKPLILKQNYFGQDGTISVGLARGNKNVWQRILGSIEGLFTAFDPAVAWTWAFSSAKAGYKDPDGSNDREYQVCWRGEKGVDVGDRGSRRTYWNLCQDDWDAVFVPVRRAHSKASGADYQSGAWGEGDTGFLVDWITSAWKNLDDDGFTWNVSWLTTTSAPPGMSGLLNWKDLSDVMYH